jgi:hypothetical protein
MASKEKLTRQRKAAEKIADIMLSSLQKFPEAEQEAPESKESASATRVVKKLPSALPFARALGHVSFPQVLSKGPFVTGSNRL